MELILWRHAEAVDGIPDHIRALTSKGQHQAERMAIFLSSRLPPHTRILVSPALRAQQTVQALTSKFTTESAIGTGATAKDILDFIGWSSAKGSILLVGHQPWLGEIASLLMTGSTHYWSVKKGAIWWLSSRERDGEEHTILRLVMSPEQL